MGVGERETEGESVSSRGERERARERKRERGGERERSAACFIFERRGKQRTSAAVLCYCVRLKEENSRHPG